MQEKKTSAIDDLVILIVNLSLIISTIIGFIAYFFSLLSYSKEGFKFSFITDLVVLIVLLTISIFRHKVSIKIKSYIIIAAIFMLFIFDVIHLGVFSANKVLIVLIPFFSNLAFNNKKSIALFLFAVLSFMLIGYFHLSGKLVAPSQAHIDLSAWIINILLIIIVSIIVFIIQNKFIHTYKKLIYKLEKTNEAISEQERNYREIFNSSTDAIFIHDLDGKILDVNDSMLKMYAYEKNDIANLDIAKLSSGQAIYTAHDAEVYVKKAVQGIPQVFDWQAKKKSGEFFWVEVALKKTNIAGSDRVLAIIRDINDKKEDSLQLELYRNHLKELVAQKTKELEQSNEELHSINDNLAHQKQELVTALEELHSTQEQLVQSEKMASLGVLAAGVAHEINNPLNFIQAGVFGLENYFDDELEDHKENIKPILNAINVGIERATGIVTSLNHYSGSHSSKTGKCDIHGIINSSLLMLQNKIKHNIEIIKEFTKQEFVLLGNEGQLHQVIVNLLLNALQGIDKKGCITISTEIINNKLKVSVKDTGVGISNENIKKIFDPFFTTKAVGEGTGLGLSISLKIIEDHKGKIEYKSEINKGTEAIISLPVKN